MAKSFTQTTDTENLVLTLRNVTPGEVWVDSIRSEASNRLIEDHPNYGQLPIISEISNNQTAIIDTEIIDLFNEDSEMMDFRLETLQNLANGQRTEGLARRLIDHAGAELLPRIAEILRSINDSEYVPIVNLVSYTVFGDTEFSHGVQELFEALNNRAAQNVPMSINLDAIRLNLDTLDANDINEAEQDNSDRQVDRSNLFRWDWWTILRRGSGLVAGVMGSYFGAPYLVPVLGRAGMWIGSTGSSEIALTQLARGTSGSTFSSGGSASTSENPDIADVGTAFLGAWRTFFRWVGGSGE